MIGTTHRHLHRSGTLWDGGTKIANEFPEHGPLTWREVENVCTNGGVVLHECVYKNTGQILDDMRDLEYAFLRAVECRCLGVDLYLNLPEAAALLYTNRIDDGSRETQNFKEERRRACAYIRCVYAAKQLDEDGFVKPYTHFFTENDFKLQPGSDPEAEVTTVEEPWVRDNPWNPLKYNQQLRVKLHRTFTSISKAELSTDYGRDDDRLPQIGIRKHMGDWKTHHLAIMRKELWDIEAMASICL